MIASARFSYSARIFRGGLSGENTNLRKHLRESFPLPSKAKLLAILVRSRLLKFFLLSLSLSARFSYIIRHSVFSSFSRAFNTGAEAGTRSVDSSHY